MAMAPMTRARAGSDGTANASTVTYYTQRASAGLIISEGLNISEQAVGSPFTPGIYTEAQIASWKKVTDAVHEKGGKIFTQLWHTGRVSHSIDVMGTLGILTRHLIIANVGYTRGDGRTGAAKRYCEHDLFWCAVSCQSRPAQTI
jgi:N-ethylmaleimide reductase